MKQTGNGTLLKRGDLFCSPLYSSHSLDRRVWLLLKQDISNLSQQSENKMISLLYYPRRKYEDFIKLRDYYYPGGEYEKFVVIK